MYAARQHIDIPIKVSNASLGRVSVFKMGMNNMDMA